MVLVIFMFQSRFGQYMHLLLFAQAFLIRLVTILFSVREMVSLGVLAYCLISPVEQLLVIRLFPIRVGLKCLSQRLVFRVCCHWLIERLGRWPVASVLPVLSSVLISWRWKLVLTCLIGFVVYDRHSTHASSVEMWCFGFFHLLNTDSNKLVT